MNYKEAITYANKVTNKKCGDGLMKDVMKACLHWFIKIAYQDGYLILEQPTMPEQDKAQFNLAFDSKEEADNA